MDNFYLIYINKVGKNYKGQYLYEFLFSELTFVFELDVIE